MFLQDWSSITLNALQKLWEGFISFLPELIGALIVFIIGWLIAVWVGKGIAELLKRLRLNRIFEKAKWDKVLEKAEFKMTVSDFIGAIIKWVLIIVFLLASVQILGLTAFAGFLKDIVSWLPNLLIAVAIFVVAAIVADFSEKLAKAIVGRMEVASSKVLGAIVKWAVWIFAVLAILSQLGIAKEIIQILVSGFVALIVISSSIAFGIGGKDLARDLLEQFRRKVGE